MKVILYMATSVDGKTTSEENNVDWVAEEDIERMDSLMKECGVMIMGRGTYKSFGDELPVGQALLVVMTHNSDLLHNTSDKDLIFTKNDPKEVLKMLDERGFKEVMLAGGETLNTAFLDENLIDEIRVIVKPIVIGKGKSLFGSIDNIKKFKLIEVSKLNNGSLELRYGISK